MDDFAQKERPNSVVDPLFVGIRLTEAVTVMGLDPDTNQNKKEGRDKVEK